MHTLDAPYLHPKWDEQVAIEQEMLAIGASRTRDRINKAKDKKSMTNLRSHRSLIHEWVVPVSEGITAWVDKVGNKQRGPKPYALRCLRLVDHDTASMVALKSILRMLGVETRGVTSIATEIGTWCEHEARAAAWMRDEPDDWKLTSAQYRKRHSTAAHQKRSRIALFNKYVHEKIDWTPWTDEERLRVGLQLISIVSEVTGRFSIMPDPQYVPKRSRGGQVMSRPIIVKPDDGLIQWLEDAMDDELVHAAAFLPCVMPPKPWEGPRDGGYWTPYVKTPFLIQFRASHQEEKQRAIDEYERIAMPTVYDALNHVQATAWKINRRIYEVASRAWKQDLAVAGMPRLEAETIPSMPDAPHDTEEYKAWTRKASEAHARNNTRFSKFISVRRALQVAERFLDEPAIYFPHKLDFRGRMYPIPSDLSPQGFDLHRGLLTFATGKPITFESSGWLAIQVANTHGKDKVSFQDRIDWVEANEERWRSIAEDPLVDRRWEDADEKNRWQALAAILEWVRWLDEGEGMVSSLPIRIDGTCNGIQHLSAMVRDREGGESVNLVNSEKPRDIYQEVADVLRVTLKEKAGEEHADYWLRLMPDGIPRSLTKRPVMILPYGGTRDAYYTYTMEWLRKQDPHGITIPKDIRSKACSFMVPILWEAVNAVVTKPKEVMEWIQKCAAAATTDGLPLHWTTPSGFTVRHFYGTRKKRQIRTLIDGQRLDVVYWEETPKLDLRRQAKGIAPNFVHSMDASALMDCVETAAHNGVESITTIHDAFGTVAADMHTLEACLRDAFIRTYETDVLLDFLTSCKDVATPEAIWPEPIAFGDLDLGEIRSSAYFFA